MSTAVDQFTEMIRQAAARAAHPVGNFDMAGPGLNYWLYCPECRDFAMHVLVGERGQQPRRYRCAYGHEWQVGK